jgi:ubiquinone/menaquinone biosynthesis C-methylase UbiE
MRKKRRKHYIKKQPSQRTRGWEYVSKWYDGMVGESGSIHHEYIIPIVMKNLSLRTGGDVLDLGCGQGVLAPYVRKAGGNYTGIDISPSLIKHAMNRHKNDGTFLVGDVHSLKKQKEIDGGSFDSAVFLLSLQDMRYPRRAIDSAVWALKPGGVLVMLLTHPAFRIPRQSGWGYDEKRKLLYRRVDSYLSPLDVPLRKDRKTNRTLTRSFHRPLSEYMTTLIKNDMIVTSFEEIPTQVKTGTMITKAEERALSEIPLFLEISARKSM